MVPFTLLNNPRTVHLLSSNKAMFFAVVFRALRSLATSAQFARSSAGTIALYKDIVATKDVRGQFHYATLAHSLTHIAKQKFNKVLAEGSLLGQYVNVARVFAAYDHELLDTDSEEYGEYKQAVEGHEKEYGRLGMRASRRRYILTQAVRGLFAENCEGSRAGFSEDKQLSKLHFAQMGKHLNTALSLSYLCEAFGPGIHALMLGSAWEKMAEAAFDDHLPEMLEQLFASSPWLKRIAERANQNVWKFSADAAVWVTCHPNLSTSRSALRETSWVPTRAQERETDQVLQEISLGPSNFNATGESHDERRVYGALASLQAGQCLSF